MHNTVPAQSPVVPVSILDLQGSDNGLVPMTWKTVMAAIPSVIKYQLTPHHRIATQLASIPSLVPIRTLLRQVDHNLSLAVQEPRNLRVCTSLLL